MVALLQLLVVHEGEDWPVGRHTVIEHVHEFHALHRQTQLCKELLMLVVEMLVQLHASSLEAQLME